MATPSARPHANIAPDCPDLRQQYQLATNRTGHSTTTQARTASHHQRPHCHPAPDEAD